MASDGPTGPAEDTTILSLQSLTGSSEPPPPPQIRLSDLLTEASVLQQQEAADRASFLAVSCPDLMVMRVKLIGWLSTGQQGNCALVRMPFVVPIVCSDGVSRNFFEYVEFVSGKTMTQHLQSLQAILPDFEVGYQCSRAELSFCVVRVIS